MPLGIMEVDIGPAHIVLDGPQLPPPPKGVHRTAPSSFRPMSIVVNRSPMSATAELLYKRSLKNEALAYFSLTH